MDNDYAALVPSSDDIDHQVDHSTPDDIGNNPPIIISTEHRNRVEEVMNRKVVTSTIRNYSSNIAKLTSWLATNYPACLDKDSSLKLPLDPSVVVAYMASIQHHVDNDQLIAVSTLSTVGSAIYDYYRKKNIALDSTLKSEISNFMSGHRKMVAEAKLNGRLPSKEGKAPLSFQGYIRVCRYALQWYQNERLGSIFPHCFTALSWNLCARSASVASLLFSHIELKNDAIGVTVPKHNGEQEGARILPVHIYANPLQPEICPFLSLAIYVFCTRFFNGEDSKPWRLFPGSSIEGKFSNWLQDTLKDPTFINMDNGAVLADIGTLSFRKGPVTYMLSFPTGPQVAAVYHRASLPLGSVQQGYIFEGEGSDQYCGRAVCGLSMLDDDFALLPPHFKNDVSISLQDWQIIHPSFSRFPLGFR
jgi:hypothetical protein